MAMTEESLADWLETQRRFQNGTLDSWSIKFFTEGFLVWIRGGEETDSVPPSYLEHISQYEKVVVRLYDRKEEPPKPKWDSFEVLGYTFTFDVHVMAHEPIFPQTDPRFRDQPWESKFRHIKSDSFAPPALLTLEELDIVLRWLKRLDDLAAFT